MACFWVAVETSYHPCGEMAQEGIDFGFSHVLEMDPAPVKLDEPDDPIAVGLLRAIGIVVVSQHLADLIHQPQIGIGFEFLLAFSVLSAYSKNMETGLIQFPYPVL